LQRLGYATGVDGEWRNFPGSEKLPEVDKAFQAHDDPRDPQTAIRIQKDRSLFWNGTNHHSYDRLHARPREDVAQNAAAACPAACPAASRLRGVQENVMRRPK